MSRLSNLNTLKIGIFGNWYSSWYDREFYNFLVFRDYKLIQYLNSVFYRLRLPTSHFYINRINQKYYYIESNIYITKHTFRRFTKSVHTYKDIFKYISLIEYLFDSVFLLPKDSISGISINKFIFEFDTFYYFLYYFFNNYNTLNLNSNILLNRFSYFYYINHLLVNSCINFFPVKYNVQLNIFSNFFKINNTLKNKFIRNYSELNKKKLNIKKLNYFYLNSFFLSSSNISLFNYIININYANTINLLHRLLFKFIFKFLFIFLNIYIIIVYNFRYYKINKNLLKCENFLISSYYYLKKINIICNYKLIIKNNVKLFLMYNFNNYSFSSILDSKKTRSTYIINHENVSNNYIHNKFNKYLNLLLSNKNNLFGFLYIQDFDEFFKKSINNSITVENDQIDAIYYKQVNHFNNFFKRIYVYFYKKFFNFFHLSIEYTISSFTGLQCFFLPTYYIKTFPIFDTKLLLDYISYNLKRRHHITKIFNKISLLQQKHNSDVSKSFINLFNEFSDLKKNALKFNKFLPYFNLGEIYQTLNVNNIYSDQIKKKKNPISGIRIEFSGPPKKAERTALVAYHDIIQDYRLIGKMPTHSVYADIHYYQSYIKLKRSTFGIKIWLFYYTRILNCNNVNKTIL